MPNKPPPWIPRVLLLLALAGGGLALAQNEAPQATPRPTPATPAPERDFRPSEEVSADDEVDFPADL